MSVFTCDVKVFHDRIYVMNTYSDYATTRPHTTGFFSLAFDYATVKLLGCTAYSLNHAIPVCDSLLLLGGTFSETSMNRFVFSGGISFNNCPKASRFFVQLDTNLNVIGNYINELSCNRDGRAFLANDYIAVDKTTGHILYGITYTTPTPTVYYAVVDTNNVPIVHREFTTGNPLAFPVMSLQEFNISSESAGLITAGTWYEINHFFIDNTSIGGSSPCIGEDTAFLVSSGLIATPATIVWTKDNAGTSVAADQPAPVSDFYINTSLLCRHTSTCDSIKIKGAPMYCLRDSTAGFTLYKNPQCDKITNWGFDTSAFSGIQQVNDTIVNVHFKKGWQGYIYATLAGCGLKDSLLVNIRAPMAKTDLGNDTVFCAGTQITLHPGSHFMNYSWQDGSADSIYIVHDTGTYRVSVTDSCGNQSADTITIRPAHIAFNLGPNREICNKDSAVLALPDGFSGYSWAPAYASLGNNTLLLYPNKTTSFQVSAQNESGCTVTDTITITVTDCSNLLYFPSAFSPNADGNNDYFRPHAGGELVFFEMAIFNRWGQQLFKTNDVQKGWDGLFHGVKQQGGAYIWVCKYQFRNDRPKTSRGSFMLIP